MWLLENLGDVFQGKRLWLRPGKLYLFGRTVAEPGQIAISDKTISRKHLTIHVDNVPEGGGRSLHGRCKVTIADQNTKLGTLVNGEQIRGSEHVISQDDNTLKMGSCVKLFRLFWHPVVFSFSFTSKELHADPWVKLREGLEQLDIKYLADYDIKSTSHVVSKKRNTSKGLQALINGKFIVTDSFISAVSAAAASENDGKSALELDFDANWPDALQHLPPRGQEPGNYPIEAYLPDERRQEIFDGYTFIFYDKTQYENLFASITNGKGKALLKEVIPRETGVDEFVLYVKSVAGEKGLGSFDDGSEGKGVVVVRYTPAKGSNLDWFIDFTNSVSLQLDHRLIEQRDFMDAILACDASRLRRPLVEASQSGTGVTTAQQAHASDAMDLDGPQEQQRHATARGGLPEANMQGPRPSHNRAGRAPKSRFRGFDASDDDEDENKASRELVPANNTEPAPSSRKRPASPVIEESSRDLMEDIAPTATAAKRRRIAAGEDPVPPRPPSIAEEDGESILEPSPAKSKTRGGKKGNKEASAAAGATEDILEMARRRREEAEAKAQAEEAEADEGEVDWATIRRLQIVEDMPVKRLAQPPAQRTRDQDIADGRWDPKWNGRRNFKKFQRQGEQPARPAARVRVGLEEVKTKAYGIGDGYWLDDESTEKEKRHKQKERESQSHGNVSQDGASSARSETNDKGKGKKPAPTPIILDDSFSSDEEEASAARDEETSGTRGVEREPARTRAAKVAERDNMRRAVQSQSQMQTQAPSQARNTRATQKRVAAAPLAAAKGAKKARKEVVETGSGDDSDEGAVKFRFGRR